MALVGEMVTVPAFGRGMVIATNVNGNPNLVRVVLSSDDSEITVDKRRFDESTPLIKEPDPELERLLQEEEEIEARSQRKLMVKATTTLSSDPNEITVEMEWPASAIRDTTLQQIFRVATKVTIERDDGAVVVYEPHWEPA